MRKISNHANEKLRKEQFDVLVEIIISIKSRGDLKLFLESFLTASEQAYLSQRLNILRMLAKSFHFMEIKQKINASNGTISNANKLLIDGGDIFKKILLQYKYKLKQTGPQISKSKAHLPESILHHLDK